MRDTSVTKIIISYTVNVSCIKAIYSNICTQRSLEFILKLSGLTKKTQRQHRDVIKFSQDHLVIFYVLHSTFHDVFIVTIIVYYSKNSK